MWLGFQIDLGLEFSMKFKQRVGSRYQMILLKGYEVRACFPSSHLSPERFLAKNKGFCTLPLQFREIKYENRYYFYDVFINIQDENANTREDLYYA